MRKAKKLAAVLLSLTMAMVFAVPAFAAGACAMALPGTTKQGHTYEAYQIYSRRCRQRRRTGGGDVRRPRAVCKHRLGPRRGWRHASCGTESR